MDPKRVCRWLTVSAKVLLSGLVIGLAFNGIAAAQSDPAWDVFKVNYYDTSVCDNTLRLVNPTYRDPASTGGFLCAMIYVFDAHEELQECCGCPVSNDGLRRLSVVSDLTANPVGGPIPTAGVIKVVASAPNQAFVENGNNTFYPCNPGNLSKLPILTETLRGWITHTNQSGRLVNLTEEELADAPLFAAELGSLVSTCQFIHTNGTGRGICKCGIGDNVAAAPRTGGR